MTRNTSKAAYASIVQNQMLPKMQLEAYKALYRHGPATARELDRYMQGAAGTSFWKRLGELVYVWGVAEEVRTRRCAVSGKTVIEYDVTDDLPKKQVVFPSDIFPTKKELHACIAELRAWAARLRTQNVRPSPELQKLIEWLIEKSE